MVSLWFNLKPADNFVVFIAREISFPYVSFFTQLDYVENLYRFFKDLFFAPIYLSYLHHYGQNGLKMSAKLIQL